MNSDLVVNFAPIFTFVYNLLALLGGLTLVLVTIFLFYNCKNVGILTRQSNRLFDRLLDKFPLVSEDFINRGLREQNVENNQEIHEQNKRLEKIEAILNKLSTSVYVCEVHNDCRNN